MSPGLALGLEERCPKMRGMVERVLLLSGTEVVQPGCCDCLHHLGNEFSAQF